MVKSSDSPDRRGEGPKVPGTTPPSACSSPVHSKPKKFSKSRGSPFNQVCSLIDLSSTPGRGRTGGGPRFPAAENSFPLHMGQVGCLRF